MNNAAIVAAEYVQEVFPLAMSMTRLMTVERLQKNYEVTGMEAVLNDGRLMGFRSPAGIRFTGTWTQTKKKTARAIDQRPKIKIVNKRITR